MYTNLYVKNKRIEACFKESLETFTYIFCYHCNKKVLIIKKKSKFI